MSRPTLDVDAVLGSVLRFREPGSSAREVLLAAGVDAVSDVELLDALRPALRERPGLLRAWQEWSYDKRWTPSPYLDDLEVGHYSAGYQHVRHHSTQADACADFVLAEVRWLVERRVIEP